MFVEDLLCEQEGRKAIILQNSDPRNQYYKVITLRSMLSVNKILLSSDY